ncbi:hypothetical protein M0R19_06255 [Candidatus Pacearchaeota archaeon]|jgi:hypothetical protein|nr:hypothetical protein [Candidatus Pacearchaeota archaeon]
MNEKVSKTLKQFYKDLYEKEPEARIKAKELFMLNMKNNPKTPEDIIIKKEWVAKAIKRRKEFFNYNRPLNDFYLLVLSYSGNLSYRKDELPVKEKLEKIFNCEFRKERIKDRYIDFASSDYLIEYTANTSRGIYLAIRRLYYDCKEDKRQKILISHVHKIGKTYREFCKDIILLPISFLENGTIEEVIKIKD